MRNPGERGALLRCYFWGEDLGQRSSEAFSDRQIAADDGFGIAPVIVPRSLHFVPHKPRHSGRDDTEGEKSLLTGTGEDGNMALYDMS